MLESYRDIRFALRSLRKNAAVTVLVVFTLALGIGANSAVFSVINAVLLEPLPFLHPSRLAMVWVDNTRLGVRTDVTSYPTYLDWRRQAHSFTDLAAYSMGAANLTGDFEAQRVEFSQTTANFFRVLGVHPMRGRAFTREEGRSDRTRVMLLSYGLWQSRFGGDPGTVGRKVNLNGAPYTVIGIMPRDFDFPAASELWLPLAPSQQERDSRGEFWLHVVGRLRPGLTVARAQNEMDEIALRIVGRLPQLKGYGVYVQSIRDHLFGDVRPALVMLLCAVALLLLIACSNVTNLLLTRALTRRREVVVRFALGATRSRLARQFLTETLVLAFLGGGLAVPVALWGVDFLKTVAPPGVPRMDQVAVHPVVLGFTGGLSLLTGIICGLLPALRPRRVSLASALRENGRTLSADRRDRRLRSIVIVGEVAMALLLLIGAGLLGRSFNALLQVDTGFQPNGVLTARIALSNPPYDEPYKIVQFWKRLLFRLNSLPGIEGAAAGSNILLKRLPWSGGVSIEGRPSSSEIRPIEVTIDAVTPGFFRTVGTRLLEGRDFGPQDRLNSAPVVIINQAMAERFWKGEKPIGKRFKWGQPQDPTPWRTIVGVVADSRRTAQARAARPSGYLPLQQVPVRNMMLVARVLQQPVKMAENLRKTVRAIDPSVPIAQLETLDGLLRNRLGTRRLLTLLLGLFSLLALILAVVGVYGVISYAVAQSRREIGIRMALGAAGSRVFGLMLRRVGLLVGEGTAIGLGMALLLRPLLTAQLYGVSAFDPVTYVAAPAVLAAAALLAALLPARRAARVDPMEAMQHE